ncbi:MAG: ABC transporter ATP-binding protein [Chloroflexota bacterium]
MSGPLLSVQDLRVTFAPGAPGQPPARAVDGVSFALAAGGSLAIVGETGSGKTTLARALLGLHPAGSVSGSVQLGGQELVELDEGRWRPLRWKRIALAVQNAGTAFDPVYRMGEQIVEPLREHLGLSSAEAAARAAALVEQVGLTERHLRAYPHQLSGGEKQRLMLAMALSCEPEILIVDEPTSGQDMLARAQVIALLRHIRAQRGTALLLISHDLAAVAQLAEQVAVLYAGKLAEVGAVRDVLSAPRHPYTWGLLNAYPNMSTARDLSGIRGQMPDPAHPPTGCRFHPRCTQAVDKCRRVEPPLQAHGGRLLACHLGGLQALLRADGLRKTFTTNGHLGPAQNIEAVRDVSLEVYEGEVVGLVGETGSGKSTLGRLLVGLLSPEAGSIAFEGNPLALNNSSTSKRLRRRIQLIPQDPFDSVSPYLSVGQIVREPLDVQGTDTPVKRAEQVQDALAAVGLPTLDAFLARHPHELSGGQLQRVVIARALVLEPKLIVADEPVSMLDASEQAKLITLLKAIQNERGIGLLLISHDLALVRKVADRILVMRDGQIIEGGPSSRVIAQPQHDYTRALLRAAPSFDWYSASSNGDRP